MGRLSKAKWCLLDCLIVVLVLVVGSVFVPSRLTGAVKWMANNDFAGKPRTLTEQEEVQEDNMAVAGAFLTSEEDLSPTLERKAEHQSCQKGDKEDA